MIVKMTVAEKMAVDYAKSRTKNWQDFIIASDAYLNAIKDVNERCNCFTSVVDLVEVEFKDGEHQLTQETFNKWKKSG